MVDFYSQVKLVGSVVNTYDTGRSKILRVMFNDQLGHRNFVSVICFGLVLESVKNDGIQIDDVVEVDGELASYDKMVGDKKMTFHNVTAKKVSRVEDVITEEVPF